MYFKWINGVAIYFFGYISLSFPLCVSLSFADEYKLYP